MRYFVSYSHRRGFGHAEVPYEGLIKNIEDIRNIAEEIEKQIKVKDVIILNFIPLDPILIGELKTGDLKVSNGPLTTVSLTSPDGINITGTVGSDKEPGTKIIK